jgi:hypothetical protein
VSLVASKLLVRGKGGKEKANLARKSGNRRREGRR